ncbi:winged helix DNA-binding domain-containing protein [Longivirga aurantiaca]|uniref:Winged helix DNA-binding domain-containing protein n=1 Tax=Longivirga aurantiaca TaxID=1837743 RepID=A0ABW1T2F5_9ACTN
MAPDPVTASGRADPLLVARLRAQLLTSRAATDPVDVVERLLAVQAQDGRGFRLAVRARSSVAGASAVDHALTHDRSLVVDWLNRGTLHLVRSEDHAWLHMLTTPRLTTAGNRRLAQEGVDAAMAERAVALVTTTLREDGPHTRAQLRDVLDAAGVRTAGQALVHVLGAASFAGLALRGPVVDGEQAFVDPESWLGPRPPLPERDVALAELARRYLAGHGPARDHDLAYWTGLPLRDARRGLAGVRGLVDHGDGLVSLHADDDAPAVPDPVLLGPFDPLLHGWKSRALVVGDDEEGVVTSNGLFRPVALVDGVAVAVWGLAGGRLTWTVRDGHRLSSPVEQALRIDAARVVDYLGS